MGLFDGGSSSAYGYSQGWSSGSNGSVTNGSAASAQAWANQMAAMEFNAKEAQKARDWMEYMSNTAYQRGVKDLKAAGLNPILAATNGSASSPSSAGATSGIAGATADSESWGFNESQQSAENSAVSYSGLAEGLRQLGNGIRELANSWGNTTTGGKLTTTAKHIAEATGEAAEEALTYINNMLKPKGEYGGGAGRVDAQKYGKK